MSPTDIEVVEDKVIFQKFFVFDFESVSGKKSSFHIDARLLVVERVPNSVCINTISL